MMSYAHLHNDEVTVQSFAYTCVVEGAPTLSGVRGNKVMACLHIGLNIFPEGLKKVTHYKFIDK